jgi:hypothetical protein
MSPELQQLVEAYYRLLNCEPHEEHRALLSYRRLFDQAALKLPTGQSRELLQEAIRARAVQMQKARNKPTTLPPQA